MPCESCRAIPVSTPPNSNAGQALGNIVLTCHFTTDSACACLRCVQTLSPHPGRMFPVGVLAPKRALADALIPSSTHHPPPSTQRAKALRSCNASTSQKETPRSWCLGETRHPGDSPRRQQLHLVVLSLFRRVGRHVPGSHSFCPEHAQQKLSNTVRRPTGKA